ncbi:MAG: hypothetical protein QM642_10340 [Edaphocola sp.]
MDFSMKEVVTKADAKTFLALPLSIYKDDPNWIRPLDKDIEDVFDKEKNKLFKQGNTCKRWLLLNGKGQAVGRIAAFVNKKYKMEQATGGIGFFECIDSRAAANFMFDYCKQWLQGQGMEAMDGPINFGERDRWWGLVIKGYYEPLYCMNYNPPYYKELFENYGFQVYFNQECYGMKVVYQFQDKFYVRHEELLKNKDLHAEPVLKKNLEKYARDFTYVYNKAWASHGGGKSLDERQAIKMFQSMKPVMDEKLCWFIYHKEEPVACWINLPDLNQFFKHLNGKFDLFHKLKFLWLKRFGKCERALGLVFGVIPEWQGKGMDAYMILEGSKIICFQTGYKDYEMQWIGDFNPKMINVAQNLGAHVTRRLATYRYLFDRNKEFKRHPFI